MKLLFFGDIVGKTGRIALQSALPDLVKKYQPDFILANGENATHGKGINESAYTFLIDLGIDCLTGGDHIFDLPETFALIDKPTTQLLRPANYPAGKGTPGKGYTVLEKNGQKLAVINLQGRVFMREGMDNPFAVVDQLLQENDLKNIPVFVDFHTEATSEIGAMGWYLDGRVAAVVGTHTHVQTNDAKILPKGTAFISDVGMCGSRDSLLGDQKESIINSFVTGLPFKLEVGDFPANVSYVCITIEDNKATNIDAAIDNLS